MECKDHGYDFEDKLCKATMGLDELLRELLYRINDLDKRMLEVETQARDYRDKNMAFD